MYDATNELTTINRSSLPVLLSVKDSAKLGISKTTFYRLSHMANLPVVIIGARRFLHRDKFFAWLDQVTEIPN